MPAYLLIFLLILLPCPAFPQFYFYNNHYYDNPCLIETGLCMGAMNCLTDLGGKKGVGKSFIKDINWNQSHPAVGIFLRFCWNQKIGVKMDLVKGSVSASDKLLKHDQSEARNRFERNLDFHSSIEEFNATIEWYPGWNSSAERSIKIRPYLFGGVGLFHFNPYTVMNGSPIRLAPLHTEGQGFREYPERRPYRLVQAEFPGGLGVCYDFSALLTIRLECRNSFLLTDYLDDVSTTYISPSSFSSNLSEDQAAPAKAVYEKRSLLPGKTSPRPGEKRGNASNKDSYFSIQIEVGYIFGRKRYN